MGICMNLQENQSNQQVTAVISHYIRPGREAGYEDWLQGISEVARKFEPTFRTLAVTSS